MGLQNVSTINFWRDRQPVVAAAAAAMFTKIPTNSSHDATGITNLPSALIKFFNAVGVNLAPPKSVFFNDRQGTLIVRAADEDLNRIETALNRLNAAPAQDSGKVTATGLDTRTFNVDPNTFVQGLRAVGVLTNQIPSSNPSGLQRAVREYFKAVGVNLEAPKSISYNDRQGILTAHATANDFDSIEKTIAPLKTPLPEVTIKARFVEVDDKFLTSLVFTNTAGASTNLQTGILTVPLFKEVLKALEKRDHGDLLNEGEVTTLSGRQANFQIMDVKTVVQGLSATETNQEMHYNYETTKMPFGTTVDVVALLSPPTVTPFK